MKDDDQEIDTAQTPKRLIGRLALLEKIRKTFTDSIPNKSHLENPRENCLEAWRLPRPGSQKISQGLL